MRSHLWRFAVAPAERVRAREVGLVASDASEAFLCEGVDSYFFRLWHLPDAGGAFCDALAAVA